MSFRILFDPGYPRAVDEYGKLPSKEQKARLANVAYEYKQNPDLVALFIINFTKKDSYSDIKKRTAFITDVLTKNFGVPKENLRFSYAENAENNRTTVYLLPAGVNKFWDGENDLEKLRPRTERRKTKTTKSPFM